MVYFFAVFLTFFAVFFSCISLVYFRRYAQMWKHSIILSRLKIGVVFSAVKISLRVTLAQSQHFVAFFLTRKTRVYVSAFKFNGDIYCNTSYCNTKSLYARVREAEKILSRYSSLPLSSLKWLLNNRVNNNNDKNNNNI